MNIYIKSIVKKAIYEILKNNFFEVAFFFTHIAFFLRSLYWVAIFEGRQFGVSTVCTIIFMSNQTIFEVEIMSWLSLGCQNKLMQTFQQLGFDIEVTFTCFYYIA